MGVDFGLRTMFSGTVWCVSQPRQRTSRWRYPAFSASPKAGDGWAGSPVPEHTLIPGYAGEPVRLLSRVLRSFRGRPNRTTVDGFARLGAHRCTMRLAGARSQSRYRSRHVEANGLYRVSIFVRSIVQTVEGAPETIPQEVVPDNDAGKWSNSQSRTGETTGRR